MLTLVPAAIEAYAREHTTAEEEIFVRLREETIANLAMPQMQVGPLEGRFLRLLVAVSKARRVLEIGTYSGYSALSMAFGLPADGRLITCDVDPNATAVARRYFDESPHGHKIDIRIGPALETIRTLTADGAVFDLVFIDADKDNYIAYWEAVLPLLPSGGLILADNTLWSGRVIEPKEASDRAIVQFNAHVKADARVEHVLLTIRDGVMLARKR